MIRKNKFKVLFIMTILLTISTITTTAFALTDDPLEVVNNLSDFSAPASNR